MTNLQRVLAGLALLVLFAIGGTVAWTQTAGETIGTQTFTNVVTYTIPTETVVSTETVTVTEPGTTTDPPTTTEPPPDPEGTLLVVTDQPWRCRASLASYATEGLPLYVVHRTSNAASRNWNVNGAIRLEDGCRGDGTPAIDLYVQIHGNGADIGPAGDSLVLAGATDIEIGSGSFIECGAGGAQGGHEDAFRANRGHRITMYGLTTGDWDSLTPTCHGAGGNLYFDNVNGDVTGTTDVRCIECKIVASAGAPTQRFGVGAGYGWSMDSGSIRSCLAAVRPNWHYRSGGQPIAVRAVDEDNFTIEFAQGTNTPLPGEPPASDCPLP